MGKMHLLSKVRVITRTYLSFRSQRHGHGCWLPVEASKASHSHSAMGAVAGLTVVAARKPAQRNTPPVVALWCVISDTMPLFSLELKAIGAELARVWFSAAAAKVWRLRLRLVLCRCGQSLATSATSGSLLLRPKSGDFG
jgi:hypothetical protein